MTYDDPHPSLPPMPPVRTDADLHRTWSSMLGDLGFSDRSLWVLFLGDDGRPSGPLLRIDELPDGPWDVAVDDLVAVCRDILDGPGGGGSVALLVTRPGAGPWHVGDRAWARFLTSAAGRVGGRVWPVHRAHDVALERVAPDDLLGRASA